jgi:E-phenylitaconyl-CoA hydratase
MLEEFNKAVTELRHDDDICVGIITGVGEKAFCAGADIKVLLPKFQQERMANREPPTITQSMGVNKPLIAAVNGYALGGGSRLH